MKKHTRFWSVLLTSFLFVGIMAAAATATVTYSVSIPSTLSVTTETPKNLEITLNATTDAYNGGYGTDKPAHSNVVITIGDTTIATAGTAPDDEITESSTITWTAVEGSNNGTWSKKVSVAITGAKVGETTATVTWNNETSSSSKITVSEPVKVTQPSITTTGETTVAWGSALSIVGSDTSKNPAETGTWTVDKTDDELAALGLAITSTDSAATIKGAGENGVWKPTATVLNTMAGGTWKGEDLTKKITLTRTVEGSDGNLTGSKEITLTFQGVDVEVSGTGATNDGWVGITTDTTDLSKTIIATGPGTLSFDVDKSNLPWLQVATEAGTDAVSGKNTLTATFTGTPNAVAKSKDVTVKATINGGTAHAKTVPLVISVAPGTFTLKKGTADAVATDLPKGEVDTGDEFTSVTLAANPGPIKWSGYDFLKTVGLTVTESGDNKEELVISGTYKVPNTISGDYTIVASNEVYPEKGKSITVTGDNKLTVWVAPSFSSSIYTVPDAKKEKHLLKKAAAQWNSVTAAANNWAATIDIGNVPTANTIGVSVGGEELVELIRAGEAVADAKYVAADSSGNSNDKYGITASLSGDSVILAGSIDRIPKGGVVHVVVSANNHAGGTSGVSKDYAVRVIGDVTEIGKGKEITIVSADNPEIDLVYGFKGQPTQTMTAVVEASAAKKIFGYGDGKKGSELNLLTLTPDDTHKYGIELYSDDAEYGNLGLYVDSERMAFKKLPITITTKNADYEVDGNGKALTKTATSKMTVTTGWGNGTDAASTPVWTVPYADQLCDEKHAVNSYDVTADPEWGTALNWTTWNKGKGPILYVPLDEALPKLEDDDPYSTPFVFKLKGYGPFDVSIKPAVATAGITPTLSQDEMGTWYVVFTGTPVAKKADKPADTQTKFTLTAKNNSTGKSAKGTITFYGLPTPDITVTADKPFGNTAAKPATVGKKLKVSPKISAGSKNIYWTFVSADWDGGTAGKTEIKTSKDLYDTYGIALTDPLKGTLAADKVTIPTGIQKPLYVTLKASTLNVVPKELGKTITQADLDEALNNPLTSKNFTAQIFIAGDKVKLATKKITVTVSGDGTPTADDYDFGDPIAFDTISAYTDTPNAETNPTLTKIKDAEGNTHTQNWWKANMTLGDYAYNKDDKTTKQYGTTQNKFAANLATDSKAPSGVSIVKSDDTNLNSFKLSGTPKPTKKGTLEVTMNNWGTVATGKISVTVNGQKPSIVVGDKPATMTSTDKTGKEVKVSLNNTDYLGSKIKWKVTSSVSSLKAKFKASDNKDTTKGGTITLTTKDFAATSTSPATITIEATDGDNNGVNKTGTATFTVYAAENAASALEALDVNDTTSAKEKGEAKVLGEGTVTMGYQRTVGNLTAGQRAQIEAKGYIIAAVLPEIETDADGQYDFEVELDADERVKPGDELVWFAFASKPTTDDEIVDFEDLEGNETEVVPAIVEGDDYPVVVAWPWLNAGTKYAPVIAVKADAEEADAMTEEGVKEAAEEAKEE